MEKAFAEKLAKYLKAEEISQEGFADQVGVTQGAVSQWLLGKSYPSFKHAVKIEHITGGKLNRLDCRPDVDCFLAATC